MKQLRSTFLISLIGFFISYAPIAKAQDVMGISVASCLSLKSMKDVAEADEISEKTALLVLYKYMNRKVCGRYMPPRLLPLEKLEHTYTDSNNIRVELWKIKGYNVWSLFEKDKVLKVTPTKQKDIGV